MVTTKHISHGVTSGYALLPGHILCPQGPGACTPCHLCCTSVRFSGQRVCGAQRLEPGHLCPLYAHSCLKPGGLVLSLGSLLKPTFPAPLLPQHGSWWGGGGRTCTFTGPWEGPQSPLELHCPPPPSSLFCWGPAGGPSLLTSSSSVAVHKE